MTPHRIFVTGLVVTLLVALALGAVISAWLHLDEFVDRCHEAGGVKVQVHCIDEDVVIDIEED